MAIHDVIRGILVVNQYPEDIGFRCPQDIRFRCPQDIRFRSCDDLVLPLILLVVKVEHLSKQFPLLRQ